MPTTVPRSVGGTLDTASASSAGIVNATPVAKTNVPTSSPSCVFTRPMIDRPTAETARAAPDRRAAPNRSGHVAPTIRSPTTTSA